MNAKASAAFMSNAWRAARKNPDPEKPKPCFLQVDRVSITTAKRGKQNTLARADKAFAPEKDHLSPRHNVL
jgi:hypothetical protein